MRKTPKTDHLAPHQFKPGQSGNPTGLPGRTPEEKKLRSLTRAQLRDMMSLVLMGDSEVLRSVADDLTAPAFKRWIACIVLKAIDRGDAGPVDILLNRVVGKVTDVVELTALKPMVVRRPSGETVTATFKEEDES